jgi:hypothetical protein
VSLVQLIGAPVRLVRCQRHGPVPSTMPSRVAPSPPDALSSPEHRDDACEVVARLCRVGGQAVEGRRRPGGKRSVQGFVPCFMRQNQGKISRSGKRSETSSSGFEPGKTPLGKPTFQPYWGKLAVRNDRRDRGNVGIIRSPIRASILPDQGRHRLRAAAVVVMIRFSPHPARRYGLRYDRVHGARRHDGDSSTFIDWLAGSCAGQNFCGNAIR